MKVRSATEPPIIQFIANSVFIASNITPYEEEIDGHILTGYEYDCVEYSKDAYLVSQMERIASLEQELQAAKILLGVD